MQLSIYLIKAESNKNIEELCSVADRRKAP